MGDAYFSFMYPFIDVGSGGSVRGMIAAADRVLKTIDDNTRVIPGHGPLSNKKELKDYRDMLAKIEGMIKAKKTLPEVAAAQPTKEFDPVWGNGFLKPEQFVAIVYQSLSQRRAVRTPAPQKPR